jgi:channel protein (hemolysin III family)
MAKRCFFLGSRLGFVVVRFVFHGFSVVSDPMVYSIPGFSEPISSLTHLGGAVVFVSLSLGLIRRGGRNTGRVVALAVFAFTCVFLLSTSGVYHLLTPGSAARAVLQRFDRAAIFGLIAGTITPVYAIFFRGLERLGKLGVVWLAAASGIVLKIIFFTDVPEGLGVTLYLGFGWVGLYAGVVLGLRYGWDFIAPMAWGAAAYSLGAILEFLRWPNLLSSIVGPHELFHLFVLAGVSRHWRFVWSCAAKNLASPDEPGEIMPSSQAGQAPPMQHGASRPLTN